MRNSLKILFVTTGLPPDRTGGAEAYAVQLAEGLGELGATTDIVGWNPGSVADSCEPHPYGTWYRLGSHVHPYFGYLRKLCWWLSTYSRNYQIVQFFDLNTVTAVGLWATRRSGITRVARDEQMISWSNLQLRHTRLPLLANWAERQLRTADQYVSVSLSEIDELVAWGVSPDRITFMPNGIPTASFPFAPFVEQPIVLCPARLREEKNHIALLRVFVNVRHAVPTAELWLAGDGPYEAALRQESARLNLESSVRFLGHVADMAALYAHCRVVALLSTAEGPSLAILEAGSAGRPAVVTRVGGLADSVVDNVTGTVVEPGDEAGAADALARFLLDDAACKAAGIAAADYVQSKRSLDVLVPSYAEYLRAHACPYSSTLHATPGGRAAADERGEVSG